jgi:hypothetical protein
MKLRTTVIMGMVIRGKPIRGQITFHGLCVSLLFLWFLNGGTVQAMETALGVMLQQSLLDNQFAGSSERGSATIISPSINLKDNGGKLQYDLSYRLDVITYHGLPETDREDHNLNIGSRIVHDPSSWHSEIRGTLGRYNLDPDGLQSANSLTDSADSRDLRSLSLSTFFEHQVTQSTHLALDAGLNRIDYEQSPSTDGAEIGAKIAKEAAWQALDWAASLRRRENQVSSNKVIIDDINLDLGYGWTRKLRTFGVVSHTEASVSNIDSDSFLLGLEYTPGKRTRLKIAVGERDHNESYALDIEYGQRHVKLTVGYDEKLQTPRQQTLQDLNNADAFHTTFRDLSISPSLQKRTDLGINIQGKRSDFRVTWFDSSREELGGLAGFRTRQQGVSLGVSRQIGSRAKVDLNLLHQETRQNEENRLDDVSLAWSKQLSRSIFTEIRLRQSEQESSNIQNNYLQRSITVSIRAEL